MKRVTIIVLLVASSACSVMNKGGARGPQIQRTNEPTQTTSSTDPSTRTVDVRPENR